MQAAVSRPHEQAWAMGKTDSDANRSDDVVAAYPKYKAASLSIDLLGKDRG